MGDAERLSHDPTFRLIGSEQIWERGAALTSRVHSFETEWLARDENFAGLAAINRALIARGRLSPAAAVQSRSDCLAVKLRPGNVHSAADSDEVLLPEIERQPNECLGIAKHTLPRSDSQISSTRGVQEPIAEIPTEMRYHPGLSGRRAQ